MRGILGAVIVLSFGLPASASAGTREEEAAALRDEIVLAAPSCTKSLSDCAGQEGCRSALEALTDYELGLSDPSTQKDAVAAWRRFVVAKNSNAACMRALLNKDLYCRTVNLVKKFDPHQNCPSSGGTHGSCWVNQNDAEWKGEEIDSLRDRLIDSDRLDWTQGCKIAP